MKIFVLFCLIAFGFHGLAYSAVNMVEKEPATDSMQKAKPKPKKKIVVSPKPIVQLHIDGYLDQKYVRLVLDVENDKDVSGYIFFEDGSHKYIYGDKEGNAFHIYNPGGGYINVILD